MWISSPGRLLVLLVVLVLAYAWLVLVLRVSGKRTLAKLNAFDFVVTIALGSTLATVVVSRQVPLVEGLLALLGLVALQFGVAVLARRSDRFDWLVTATPTALVVRGRIRKSAMDRCRVRSDEVAAALRKHGLSSCGEADLVVLETDGTISVVPTVRDWSAIEGVDGVEGADVTTDVDR